jgi:mRNA interferase RelE/StbE
VTFRPRAVRDLEGLAPDVRARLAPHVTALARQPRPAGAEKLKGGKDAYRIRVGDYRILYEIRDRALVVLVIRVGHRREIYESFRRDG